MNNNMNQVQSMPVADDFIVQDLSIQDPAVEELFGSEIKARRQAETEALRSNTRLRLAVQNILNSEDGQEFFYVLLQQTRVFAPSFTGNSETFYLEGKRSIGLFLYSLLMQADPLALQKIIEYRRKK